MVTTNLSLTKKETEIVVENSRKQYPVKFIDELKPDFIGFPLELATYLANLVYKSLGDELIETLNANSTEAEKYQYNETLKAFVNCSLFKVLNLRVAQDFRAYLVEHNSVEISSSYRGDLKDEFLEVRPISNQRDMEKRWFAVKVFIDQSDLKQVVLNLFDRQDQRDKEILCKIYGIYGYTESAVRDVAAEYELSRARVYQISNLFEQKTRRRIHRTASIVRSRRDQAASNAAGIQKFVVKPVVATDATLINWLIDFGNALLSHRIGFTCAFDYLSLKFPDEYQFLKKLVPFLRDAESFFGFVSDMNSRMIPPKASSFDGPIVGDLSLIERLADVDIAALPLPIRVINVLKAADIHTADQLARLTLDQMYHMPNLGRKSMKSIVEFFKLYES